MNFDQCNGTTYMIQKGDTLYSISRRYNIPLAMILRANPYVDVYNLQIGDELCIPSQSGTMPCNGPGCNQSNSSGVRPQRPGSRPGGRPVREQGPTRVFMPNGPIEDGPGPVVNNIPQEGPGPVVERVPVEEGPGPVTSGSGINPEMNGSIAYEGPAMEEMNDNVTYGTVENDSRENESEVGGAVRLFQTPNMPVSNTTTSEYDYMSDVQTRANDEARSIGMLNQSAMDRMMNGQENFNYYRDALLGMQNGSVTPTNRNSSNMSSAGSVMNNTGSYQNMSTSTQYAANNTMNNSRNDAAGNIAVVTYVVRDKDTLASVLNCFNMAIEDLLYYNEAEKLELRPGSIIRLPTTVSD